jgi:hypothetical protein
MAISCALKRPEVPELWKSLTFAACITRYCLMLAEFGQLALRLANGAPLATLLSKPEAQANIARTAAPNNCNL